MGCLVSKDQQIGNKVCGMLPGTRMPGRGWLPIRFLQATKVYDLRQVVEVVLTHTPQPKQHMGVLGPLVENIVVLLLDEVQDAAERLRIPG